MNMHPDRASEVVKVLMPFLRPGQSGCICTLAFTHTQAQQAHAHAHTHMHACMLYYHGLHHLTSQIHKPSHTLAYSVHHTCLHTQAATHLPTPSLACPSPVPGRRDSHPDAQVCRDWARQESGRGQAHKEHGGGPGQGWGRKR